VKPFVTKSKSNNVPLTIQVY